MGETERAKAGKPDRRYCWSCGHEYTPIVAHSTTGAGSMWIPRHDRRGLEEEPCPAGGTVVPW